MELKRRDKSSFLIFLNYKRHILSYYGGINIKKYPKIRQCADFSVKS
jgi:hypothetical protein